MQNLEVSAVQTRESSKNKSTKPFRTFSPTSGVSLTFLASGYQVEVGR